MEIEVKRGYEILPDNNIAFGIRITNNTRFVISDIQIIFDYNEYLFKLKDNRVLKLDNIPPTITRTARFILKPMECVNNEKIDAIITYRDPKWEKHTITMRPKEVHCICPFLRSRSMTKRQFLQLSKKGYSTETGINFEGINAEEITSFLMRTCSSNLYAVDGYTIEEGNVLYFSSEAIGEKAYYLLTALIKENEGLTQVMFRAVSDRAHGVQAFLNEIVSQLTHFATTASSAKARNVGAIRNEHVISIIDSVMQSDKKSNLSLVKSDPSLITENSVVRISDISSAKANGRNYRNSEDTDIARMYDRYLKEVKNKQKKKKSQNIPSASYPQESFSSERKLRTFHGTTPPRKEKPAANKRKRTRKKAIYQVLMIAVLMIGAGYLIQSPVIQESIGGKYLSSSDTDAAESVVKDIFSAVNEGKFNIAFHLCQGQDFLVPASIEMMFANNGIEPGGIKKYHIVSTNMTDDLAVIEANCTAVSFDIMGNEDEMSVVPVYFRLQKNGMDWMITGIAFDQPYGI